MSLGLTGKFDILQRSPHDQLAPLVLEGPAGAPTHHWVPSRYNVRATADDGRLVLWNTLSGKITAFAAEDRETVLELLHRQGLEAPQEKVVGYLAERGYLVRRGVDEYRQFQQLFGQQHYRTDVLELILLASEDCNFRCTYCYEDFARGTMVPAVREGIKNLVRKRIGKLNRLGVSWFGGEPLYGWEAVEDLAPFFVEIADEHEVSFGSNMTTNGYLLTPQVADKLLAWRIRHFQITLDGLAEHHDHARVGRDGSPTFATIFDNVKALARRDDDFRVDLRVNFDRVNAPGLSQFVDILAQEFKDDRRFSLALHAVGKWGGPNDARLEVCGGDDQQRVQRDILAQARRQGLHFGSLKDAARLGSQACYAARPYNFLIGASGKVMKCTIVLDKDDYNVVGRITEDGELELDADRMALWTEPAYEQDGKCRKCVMLPNCQGIHCPMVRIEQDTQPCISTRSNPKGELRAILDAPGNLGRRVPAARRQGMKSAAGAAPRAAQLGAEA
ncbi:MAG TPA: radical SAM protein [Thermoanaerobaculia bacterium]|nr:radical SAM protein [Thermoanaerobaculia bacterium]